jgi:hypothetical protein
MLADEDGSRPRTAERRMAWPDAAEEAERAGRALGEELHRS